jgi:hypothetical protein
MCCFERIFNSLNRAANAVAVNNETVWVKENLPWFLGLKKPLS